MPIKNTIVPVYNKRQLNENNKPLTKQLHIDLPEQHKAR